MSLYSMRSLPTPSNYTITKFDDDLNVESSYPFDASPGQFSCSCPAGGRPTCRHRQMYSQLLQRVDTAWMLDFDTKEWVDPTGEAGPEGLSKSDVPLGPKGLATSPSDPATPNRTVLEESQSPPEKPVVLDDSHPFRRRM